jgi:hypothetical protein
MGELERLEGPPLDEVGDQSWLSDGGEVGRVPALDRGRETRHEVVTRRYVFHVGVGILLGEAVDDGLNACLLVSHPDPHERDGARDFPAGRCGRLRSGAGVGCLRLADRRRNLLVIPATRGDEEGHQQKHEPQ